MSQESWLQTRGAGAGEPPARWGVGGGGTPVAAQKTVQVHVSFKYLALEISPGTTLIQFTVSG